MCQTSPATELAFQLWGNSAQAACSQRLTFSPTDLNLKPAQATNKHNTHNETVFGTSTLLPQTFILWLDMRTWIAWVDMIEALEVHIQLNNGFAATSTTLRPLGAAY